MEVSANDIVEEFCCCDTAKLTGPVCSEYFERGDVSPFRIRPLLYLRIIREKSKQNHRKYARDATR